MDVGSCNDLVIKPHEDCVNPHILWQKIQHTLNKVEVEPLPLDTPIYDNKASFYFQ
jgi:hypothetical protein